MIILDCEQKSDAWHKARLGIPTASGFCKLVAATGARRKGTTPAKYIEELVYDLVTGATPDQFQSFAMRRGVELEPHARAWYELATGEKVRKVGFVYGSEAREWGCSPDGLVGENGGIEIKCLSRSGFIAAVTGRLDEDYVIQAQGEMWVCGADWWDLVTYTEEDNKPLGHITRLTKDYAMHESFSEVIPDASISVRGIADCVRASLGKHGSITMRMIQDALGPDWFRFDPEGEKDLTSGTMEASEL
jgi:hypothetical protein